MKVLKRILLLLMLVAPLWSYSQSLPLILPEDAFICAGDTFPWRDKKYDVSGDYEDIVKTTDLTQDSIIYRLHLTVWPKVTVYETHELVDGETYRWNGKDYSVAGVYQYIVPNEHGCDSVVQLTLTKKTTVSIVEEKAVICLGESYPWRHGHYKESGVYEEIVKTKDGLQDSIHYVLNLTVRYIPVTYENVTICQGESYSFGGSTYYESGTHTHTFKVDGCDSTVVLSLNVRAVDTIVHVHQMKEGEEYKWGGKTLDKPGVYDIVKPNRFGCDSVSRLILSVNHVDTVDTVATICTGEALTWHGITGRETHHYTRIETLPSGDQVIYRLDLTVRAVKEVPKYFSLCDGSEVTFNGKTYNEAGTYFDYYTCDTIFRVVIQRIPSRVFITRAVFDGSAPYIWYYNGTSKSIPKAGTYEERVPNGTTGCVDIYRLILTLDSTEYHFEEEVTICENEDYSWHGKAGLNRQGIGTTTDYYDNYTTASGRDSIYHLALTVLPVGRSSRTIRFCDQIELGGTIYTESTTIYDTVAGANGCDSIIRIYLDKAPSYTFNETATIVQGETLNWYDLQITTNGVYRKTFKTQFGCDSIYILTVSLEAATPQQPMFTTKWSICEGDVYTWHYHKDGRYEGHEYTASGTYVDTIHAVWAADPDTVYVLSLTVHPTQKDTTVHHLYSCSDEESGTIRYNGVEYFEDTVLINTFHTAYGCDSVVKAYLHFHTQSFQSDTLRIADNDTMRFWHGQRINHAGTYRYEEPVSGSPDCYHREELVVFTYKTFLYVKDTAICQNETPYIWYDGPADKLDERYSHTPGETKTYEHKYKTVDGVDSIYRLNLTIYPVYEYRQRIDFCEGEEVTFNGKVYSYLRPDSVYRDTTILRTPHNCDSIVYTEIVQHPVKHTITNKILHEGDTIFWEGDTITKGVYPKRHVYSQAVNGCDSIVELVVREEMYDEEFICLLDTPYQWRGKDYRSGGIWHDTSWYDTDKLFIKELWTLNLHVSTPPDTTIYLHGCNKEGVVWRGYLHLKDSSFIDRVPVDPFTPEAPCDTVYRVTIKMDTTYSIEIDTTLCEHQLPLIIGRNFPDTIWDERPRQIPDTTSCGCDSTINVRLHIIPDLKRNDSVVVCEWNIKDKPVILGDTVHPAFAWAGGPWEDESLWKGKWHGVPYYDDTIVHNCDSSYFFHVIVKPHEFKDSVYYMCEGDSVLFGWPEPKWIKTEGYFYDSVPSRKGWTDDIHGITYNIDTLLCDSITQLEIRFRHPEFKDTTAHIPVGDSIWWGGEYRFYTGDYDSIGHAKDIDSRGEYCSLTYTLHLVVEPTYYFRDTIDLCYDSLRIYKHKWKTDGNYIQSIRTPNRDSSLHYIDSFKTVPWRFDSIYDLYVHFHRVQRTRLTASICEGDSMRFGLTKMHKERFLTKSGTYYDTLVSNLNSCDSIIELALNVYPRRFSHQRQDIADVDTPFIWTHAWKENNVLKQDTDTLFGTGEYRRVLKSVFGCDSIDSLTLVVHKTYKIQEDTLIICHSEIPYKWQDRDDITKSGLYTYFGRTFDGYDSIRTIYIHVLPVLKDTIRRAICEGDSLRFGLTKSHKERFVHIPGTYNDTLTTLKGCDSIVTLILSVHPNRFSHKVVHIADVAKPYIWEHPIVVSGVKDTLRDTLFVTGGYSRRLETVFGCDSIDSLSLFIHNTYFIKEDTITICHNQTPYTWQDRDDITKSGLYTYFGRTFDGYDSIRTIYIHVLPVLKDTIRRAICEGDSLRFGRKTLTKGGVYNDTLTSRLGCDSIETLILTVNKPFYHFEKVHIYEDQTYSFYGKGLNISGTYRHDSVTPAGCDSVNVIELVVHPLIDTIVTVCAYDLPYMWRNKWSGKTTPLYRAGLYHNDTTYVNGERTFWSIQLNVNEPKFDTVRHEMCEGSNYSFDGKNYTTGVTVTDTLTHPNGCDSIVTLVLTVHKPYHHIERVDILEGQTYSFYGVDYGTTGTYPHFAHTPAGCDSTTILQLTVHPLIDTTVTVCASELPFVWHNKWSNKEEKYYTSGTYRNDTTIEKRKYFYGVKLVVNQPSDTILYRSICQGSVYNFNGQQLDKQGDYRDTLKNVYGCDSIVRLQLTVLPLYHNIVTRTIFEGDTVHFLGETYKETGRYPFRFTSVVTGCDSVVELNLVVRKLFDDSITVCQNELPYKWKDNELWESGIYRDTTSDASGQPVYSSIKLRVLPVLRKTEPIVVTICEGASYPFNGRLLTEQGTYYDTLTSTQYGCDSIVTLTLQTIPQSFNSERRSIFDGDSTLFYDKWYKTPGTYTYQEDNGNECFNVHELVLTVLTVATRDTTAIICEHELPFIWNSEQFNASGNYERRTTWNDSVRVVTTLHLTVNKGFYGERNISLCQGSTYIYKGVPYTEKGFFYDTIPSLHGCDSIIKYIISVHPTYDRIDTVHISDKQKYYFPGRGWLNQSGYYEASDTTQYGCDSVRHLVLIVHPSYYNYDSIDLCQGDTLDWHGQKIFKSGLYSDSLLTKTYSFDSVYQVRVVVYPKYFLEQQYEITEGNPTYIHGINISQPGVYYDSLYTKHGCDSVYKVVVNWARKFTQHWDVTICQGDDYKFFGKQLSHSGEYSYTSLNKDSTIYLKLTVNPTSITENRVVITADDLPYIYNGRTYEKAGLYADTFVNRYKCDSIVRLNLVVTTHYSEWEQMALCPGQSIKIDGDVITKAGTYVFVKRSKVTGVLDSLYRVEVFDAPDYESPYDTITICEGDTIMFAGKPVWRGGAYTANFKTIHGCDSILHLFLVVNPSYQFPTKATITDYQSYTWRGKEYNKPGVYTQVYPTIKDCDSTYLLELTVLETKRIVVSDSICYRDTLRWRDHLLTDPGTYSDTILNLASHTSVIYTLNLHVVTPTIIRSASVTETAADVEKFYIHFTYSGIRPTSYNIQFDELAHSEGFKDIVNKPFGLEIVAEVPMPKKEKVVYQEHTAYVKPDYYTMRLALDNGVCGLSRSDSLSLLIKYPSWILEQNWDNVVAPLKSTYNGGYEFGAYRWFVNDTEFENDGLPYLYSNDLNPGDRVVLHATRIGESYAIPTAPLIITTAPSDVFPTPVLVYPTAAPKGKPIVTLKAEKAGTYYVYSSTGHLYSTGTFDSGEQPVELPATSGCCLIKATTQDGFMLTEKVIIY